jgi:hypothetical protein
MCINSFFQIFFQKVSEVHTQASRSSSRHPSDESLSKFDRPLSTELSNADKCSQSLGDWASCLFDNSNLCGISCGGHIPENPVFDDCNNAKTILGNLGVCCPNCATQSNEIAQCVCESLEQNPNSHAKISTFSPGILVITLLCSQTLNNFIDCMKSNPSCEISCKGQVPENQVIVDCNNAKTILDNLGVCCPNCTTQCKEIAECVCVSLEQNPNSHATTLTSSRRV